MRSILIVGLLVVAVGVSATGGIAAGSPSPVAEGPIAAAIDGERATNAPPIAQELDETEPRNDSAGRIVEIYPNPPRPQNHGEYVVVAIDRPGNWTLTDGHTVVRLPANRTGSIAVTRHPEKTAAFTDVSPFEAPASFRIAVDGETLSLKREGELVDRVRYDRAPESQRWLRADGGWRPEGLEPRSIATFEDGQVTAFVLPDSPEVPIETLETADDRIYLGAYTLSSWEVAETLIAANRSGVDVHVLVEGGPVGGIATEQADVLDTLVEAGIRVEAIGGDRSRFRFHHPKYAVVDDRAIVLSENWKPSGTGGEDSRGWGVVVSDPAVADELAAVHEHDRGWEDTIDWAVYRDHVETFEITSSTGSYPTHHEAETFDVDSVTVITAPGNAETAVIEAIEDADRRVDVKQPRIAGTDLPKLRAAIAAAERGVTVRILLSDAWYDEDANEALARLLNDRAEREGLPLEVRVDDPADRYGKIHAKGVIADDIAIVSSLNWNNNSARNNREVGVLIEDEAVAAYYRDVFEADWTAEEGSDWTGDRPIAPVVLVGVVAALGLYYARRTIEFEGIDY